MDERPRNVQRIVTLAIVFAIALTVRVLYLTQIDDLIFFKHYVGDAQGYDVWGRRIAAGQWWGPDSFYQAPLYPYLLGCVYWIVGPGPWIVRLMQCALGAASCVLITLAATRLFSRRAGTLAGIILAVYPPGIFYDGLIQKTSLAGFLMSVLVLFVVRAMQRPNGARWLWVGVAIGSMSLVRENALVLTPALALWLGMRSPISIVSRGDGVSETRQAQPAPARGRWQHAIMLVMGSGVVLLPVAIHNYIFGGGLAVTTYQLGPNFYMGNREGADGRIRALIPGRETFEHERVDAIQLAESAVGRSLSPQEVSNYWVGQAIKYITSDPVGWFKLMGRKWWLTWNYYEIPDTESYYIYREKSWMLNWTGTIFHFGVLCPMAVLGGWWTRTQWRGLVPFYMMLLTIAFAVTLFFVFGRYRYPLVPILAMLAGVGLSGSYAAIRSGDRRGLVIAAGLLIGSAAWTNWPINPTAELHAAQLGNLGATLARQGRIDEAVPIFARAVELLPNAPRLLQFLADGLSLVDRHEAAIPHYRELLALDPDRPNIAFNFGVALESIGNRDEALQYYRRALQLDAGDTQARQAIQRLRDLSE